MQERLKAWGRTLRTAFIVVCLSALVVGAALTTLSGVAIVNSTGAFTALSDSALSSGCVGTVSGTFSNSNCLSQVNLSFLTQNLASNVSVSSDTATLIDSHTFSALPAACGTNGCRLRIRYGYYMSGGVVGFCYANDGTANFAMSSSGSVNDNFSTCFGAALSVAQFSAGASPTIQIYTVNYGSATVCTTTGGSSPCNTPEGSWPVVNSGMQVEVVPSN